MCMFVTSLAKKKHLSGSEPFKADDEAYPRIHVVCMKNEIYRKTQTRVFVCFCFIIDLILLAFFLCFIFFFFSK